ERQIKSNSRSELTRIWRGTDRQQLTTRSVPSSAHIEKRNRLRRERKTDNWLPRMKLYCTQCAGCRTQIPPATTVRPACRREDWRFSRQERATRYRAPDSATVPPLPHHESPA